MNKPITEEQALYRLSALCSKSEHCSGDMTTKLRQWGFDEQAQARILERLTAEKFVDDERYARAFIDDKLHANGWGPLKISQGLRQKQVDSTITGAALSEVGEEQWLSVLMPLLRQKWPTITAATDYDRSMKLIKFAYSRGFDLDLIRKCIDSMGLEDS